MFQLKLDTILHIQHVHRARGSLRPVLVVIPHYVLIYLHYFAAWCKLICDENWLLKRDLLWIEIVSSPSDSFHVFLCLTAFHAKIPAITARIEMRTLEQKEVECKQTKATRMRNNQKRTNHFGTSNELHMYLYDWSAANISLDRKNLFAGRILRTTFVFHKKCQLKIKGQ